MKNTKIVTTKKSAKENIKKCGLQFKKTKLGQAVFVKKGATSAHRGLFPDDWTKAQLRAMADYMEVNPNCTIFSDGSGSPCK